MMHFNRPVKFLFIFFVIASGISTTRSQYDPSKKFTDAADEYIKRYVNNGDFSGNVIVTKNGKIIFDRSYGEMVMDPKMPMRKDAQFRIASVSKTFTAAAIVILSNKGKLDLNNKLKKFIPDFIGADSISIRHLLLHQSGVADIDYDKFSKNELTLNETINTIKNKPLYFPPGTQSRYSNSGYLLLAFIIEKASGKTYEQFLREEIFQKLSMNNTGVDKDDIAISNMATGYSPGESATGIMSPPYYDINLETGSGSLYSTVDDLLKWMDAITQKKLFDIDALEYPYGWGVRNHFSGKKCLVQSGFLHGYSSCIAMYPSEKLFIVSLSNISSSFGEESAKDLAAIYFNESYSLPEARKNIVLDDFSPYPGKYIFPGYKNFFIERKGAAIYWRFEDEQTGAPLAPLAEDTFLLRFNNTKIVFQKNENGKIKSLSFGGGANAVTCNKSD